MTTPLLALLAFCAWTVLLLLAIGFARVALVLGGHKSPNEFPGGVPHGGDRYWRLNRAHLNCLEFLPLLTAVVMVASMLGVQTPLLDRYAMLIPLARVGQSAAHVASGNNLAVNVRFAFFGVQVVCLIGMAWITYSVGVG